MRNDNLEPHKAYKKAVAVGSRQKAKSRGRFNSLKFKVQSLMLIRGKATALK
jgi:hypothetical protein